MKTEINPQDTSRAEAFALWMKSNVPMVTLVKTIDVTHLVKVSKRSGRKFNMLLCWCVGKAASQIEEFYTLPSQGKMYKYDKLSVNVIVPNAMGGINSCDVPFSEDREDFNNEYIRLTEIVSQQCTSFFQDDAMVVGTSAMVQTELSCIVNQYTDQFCNPMVMWGRYHKGWFRRTLPVSFQFHHVQMDGAHGAQFLENLQQIIQTIR